MTYRIRNWHKHFENGEALRYKGTWSWFPLPNQHDGKYWRRLWQLKNAPEVFAAFILMLELASKMPERGTLADEDGELSTTDMAMKTCAPQRIFDNAIPCLLKISWIEEATICTDLRRPAQTCVVYNITGENSTEQEKEQKEQDRPGVPPEVGIEWYLSNRLFTAIQTRNPGHKKPDLSKWASHVGFMIRVDKRDPKEIERVIDWCQDDPFWQNNILSTEKLRKQYDQLVLKMGKSKPIDNCPKL